MSAIGNPSAALSTAGPVLVVGTGLLGTSLALALSAAGVEVQLADTSPTSLALARDMGAGRVRDEHCAEPQIIVVATPPDVAASVVLRELAAHPEAVVTDVASVKQRIGAEVRARGGQD
ncbi:prephenate dehydrogenase/arogenate dehydrogenase family protein, partial [Actinomyces sp. MRS3W]|uniref:prephenate dehydrogenase/arogenate dehydrogenase family protein n=1 Tax=Actinomyces sp. MRS3W TaxID=2800796 RepID=UPI0028FD3080